MLKVMIVDNENAIRKGLVHFIDWNSLDCEIACQAADGLEAMEALTTIPIDIVITDIRMPRMDGIALAANLYQKYPGTKVIMLTGFPDFEYAQKSIDYHVVDFVLKPTSVDKLIEAIQKAKAQLAKEKAYIDLSEHLSSKGAENKKLQQNILFYDWLYATTFSPDDIKARMQKLDLDISNYYVLRFSISFHSNTEDDHIKAMKEAQEIITDCFAAIPTFFVPKSPCSCYVIVSTNAESTLTKRCYEIIDITNSMTVFSITIGISIIHGQLQEIHNAVAEADNAQRFLEYYREDGAIKYQQLPRLSREVSKKVAAILKHLTTALENCSLEQIKTSYWKLFNYIYSIKIPYEEIKRICDLLYNLTLGLLYDYDISEFISKESLPSLNQLLEGDTKDWQHQKLYSFICDIVTCINQNTDSIDSIILTVKNYIDQNIKQELSLEHLANMVYLSPSYLSKLFKKEMNINISVYVQNVRIEKAKLLLKNTNKKTYEIAEAVGIADPVYFSRIFKKVMGINPKEYRTQ